MGYFLSDTNSVIVSEVQLTNILMNFNIHQILDIIDAAIDNRYNSFVLVEPNIVDGFESDFKYLSSTYTFGGDEILKTREETYITVIEHLCSRFGFEFNPDYEGDLYSAASILYSVFVSNMRTNIVNFFANFICKEKKYLFDNLGLVNYKKDKDISTAYNKKIQKDQRLAVITTYLDYVIKNISAFDVTLDAFLINAGLDQSLYQFILNNLKVTTDFYKCNVIKAIESPIRNIFLSYINGTIKSISQLNDINISNIE